MKFSRTSNVSPLLLVSATCILIAGLVQVDAKVNQHHHAAVAPAHNLSQHPNHIPDKDGKGNHQAFPATKDHQIKPHGHAAVDYSGKEEDAAALKFSEDAGWKHARENWNCGTEESDWKMNCFMWKLHSDTIEEYLEYVKQRHEAVNDPTMFQLRPYFTQEQIRDGKEQDTHVPLRTAMEKMIEAHNILFGIPPTIVEPELYTKNSRAMEKLSRLKFKASLAKRNEGHERFQEISGILRQAIKLAEEGDLQLKGLDLGTLKEELRWYEIEDSEEPESIEQDDELVAEMERLRQLYGRH